MCNYFLNRYFNSTFVEFLWMEKMCNTILNIKFWIPGLCVLFFLNCSPVPPQPSAASFYSTEDFAKVPKIDAHVHIRTKDTAFVHQAIKDNFRLISIVVDEDPGIAVQQQDAIMQMQLFPEQISFATTFSVQNFNNDNWVKQTIDTLMQSFMQGAIAVKVYKNIGMELRNTQGKLVMVDDPKFKPIWDFLVESKIPVIGHLGEPKNCWLPVDQMTINSDKRYFSRHPEFHMYLHPEFPSYEEQINARDRMLEQNPDLRFIGAHLGSLEWSTDELAKRLDRFPNMAVDMAARISHLQYQSMHNWQKVYDFFIRYQDRLIYGTDRIADDSKAPDETKQFAHETWMKDWKFFCTSDTLRSGSFEGIFKGLKLPESVVDKIYYSNAVQWFSKLKQSKN